MLKDTTYLLSQEENLDVIKKIKTRASTASGPPQDDYLLGRNHFCTK